MPSVTTVNHLHQFSPDRVYRYTLWREFDPKNPRYLMVVGLNPSTAVELVNDQTLRTCIKYARSWGYGSLCMTNIFAYRETNRDRMKAHPEPIGPDNDSWLKSMAVGADLVLAAWGTYGSHLGRAAEVMRMLGPLHCLAINNDGSPHHPLYLSENAKPISYSTVIP